MSQNDEDFAALLAEYEGGKADKRRREPKPGEQVVGRVVTIGRDAVFIDLGGKADGMLEIGEVKDADGNLTVAIGDEIEARVVEVGGKAGCVVLRRVLGRGADAKGELQQAFELRIPVEGLVTAVNKGGVEVQVAGVRGFCPISQLDARPVEDAQAFVGQRLQFRISRYESDKRGVNVVLSRRDLLEEAAREQAAVTRERLQPGAVLRGRVTALKDYGAFVDLGGIEGMLHVSQLGFQRVAHPKDVLTVGQEIDVQVLKVEKTGDERRPERVALSLKALERDPWAEVTERIPEGAKLPGTVVRVETYGAFVELSPGVEGLVHVSELGARRQVRHAREVVKVGQRVEVTVLEVDARLRRIALSLAVSDADSAGDAPLPSANQSFGTLADLLKRKR